MNADAQLLRRYVEEHAEEAFTGFVHRHLGLVYSGVGGILTVARLVGALIGGVFLVGQQYRTNAALTAELAQLEVEPPAIATLRAESRQLAQNARAIADLRRAVAALPDGGAERNCDATNASNLSLAGTLPPVSRFRRFLRRRFARRLASRQFSPSTHAPRMDMIYRPLGKSGLQVSALSFGAWVTFGRQIGEPVAQQLLHAAYDAGVNFFDNAEAYADGQAEVVMGAILKKSGWRRSSYLVSSKVFFGYEDEKPNQAGLSRKHVVEACHAALARLQVDYLDLYYCHRPDPTTPVLETARAMHDLIVRGKVLYWGTSEWSAAQIAAAQRVCAEHHLHAPIVEQPQYNLFHRARVETEYSPLYQSATGLGTTIWSPLASGLLTGKYNSGVPQHSRLDAPGMEWLRDLILKQPGIEKKLAAVPRFAAIAAELGTSLPRLALAWCLKNPHVSTVILGASRVEQLTENLGALALVDQLTPAVMQRLDAISRPVAD